MGTVGIMNCGVGLLKALQKSSRRSDQDCNFAHSFVIHREPAHLFYILYPRHFFYYISYTPRLLRPLNTHPRLLRLLNTPVGPVTSAGIMCASYQFEELDLCVAPQEDPMTKTIKAFQYIAVVGAMTGGLAVVALRAQISSPLITMAARLAAGPDYATDVLGDAWNMCNPDDISVDPDELKGWGDFAFYPAAAGRPCLAGGTTAKNGTANDTNLSLLYRGFEDIVNPGRSGLRSPIDPNVYKKVAFKMFSGATPNWQVPQVYWFHRGYTTADLNPAFGVRLVGATGNNVTGNVNSTKVYAADLTQALNDGTAWTDTTFGPVRGLRIDPNSHDSGHQVFFYWARLTRADTDPLAVHTTVSWSGTSGTTTIDVLDAGSGSDNAILNIGSMTGTSGAFEWYYGILPPGSYVLRITSGTGIQTKPFSINTPPSLTILDPDETGGEDFATKVLGNAWDMNDASDVPFAAHLSSSSFHDGLFDGISDGINYGADGISGDPAAFFLANGNNQIPLDSQRYRFLTFKMQLVAPFSMGLGSVARVFWGPTQISATNLTTTKDIIMWPGMRSYTIDLGSLTAAAGGGIEPAGPSTQTWTAAPIRQFRIDPDEFLGATRFQIDNVKLAAMDETVGESFVIRFAGSDPDSGDVPLVTLYYDTNNNAADGRTQIAAGLPLSAGQYTWNTASIPRGVYYISADVTDGLNKQTAYSTGQLQVGNAAPPPAAKGNEVAMDFGASGLWAMYNNGSFSQLNAANPGAMASGDLDGDGKDDLIVSFPGAGVWVWSNNSSWYQLHTSDAASIATGDLDGNGKSEVLLDFPGLGVWVRLNNSSWFRLHPGSPSRMVTADLDGNGQDEVILDFPGSGVWVYKNNTSWSQLHTANASAMVAGDFDGSGRADLLLDFPGSGLWVLSNNTSWFHLHGSDSAVMTTGDLDGNGRAEAIISFPGAGIWAWMNGGSFVQLHTSSAALMMAADLDGNGRDDAIVSFPGGGVWAFMNNANWRQLHTSNPEVITAGKLDGN